MENFLELDNVNVIINNILICHGKRGEGESFFAVDFLLIKNFVVCKC
jgi:hypothetical protein